MGAFSLPTTGPADRDPRAMRNPILDEIDAAANNAHAQLSPPAQEALKRAGAPVPQQQAQVQPIKPPTQAPAPIIVPKSPQEEAQSAELARITAPPPTDPALLHTHANMGASGIQQIHNPVGRTALNVLQAIGAGFAPGLTAAIPGTDLHHEMLVRQTEGNLKAAEGEREAEEKARLSAAGESKDIAQAANLQSEADILHPAQAAHFNAEAQALLNPAEKGGTVHEDSEGNMWIIHADGKATAVSAPGGSQLKGKSPAEQKGTVHTDADGNMWIVKDDGSATPVKPKGQPEAGQLKAKPLAETVSPEQQFINEYQKTHQGASIAEAQRAYEQNKQLPQRVSPEAAINTLDRETTRFAKPHETALAASSSQLEKIADARAMINGSAEAQALGIPKVLTALVSGQGSGVRITQAEMNAIAKARGVEGGIGGFINQVSGKGRLTAQQQQQLTQILDDAKSRIVQKQAVAAEALDRINGARSREEILQADRDARKKLGDIEKATTSGASEKAAEGGYQVGHKYGGLTYLGGPVNDQNNWKK